ncbi:MAG TPA: hypothetical protein VFG51_00520 [Candidatus Saccharimonadia bacterium]|nr:hypothetical protein [Candidatus Saccharimonadia bacterium]
MFEFSYSTALVVSFFAVLIPTTMVIVSAVASAKAMGGTLGQGLKKLAAGTIVETVIITTYIVLANGNRGLLDDNQIRAFFVVSGLLGSFFLIWGYAQIYTITKKLKLFTVA